MYTYRVLLLPFSKKVCKQTDGVVDSPIFQGDTEVWFSWVKVALELMFYISVCNFADSAFSDQCRVLGRRAWETLWGFREGLNLSPFQQR